MSERRVWNSSSSRATTVTVLLPGLRATSASKAMSPVLPSGTTLKKTFWSFTKTKTSRSRVDGLPAGTLAVPVRWSFSPSTLAGAPGRDRG